MIFKELISKIENRSARIGIVGLGYVGLPLVFRFCEEGFKVTGFDVDPRKIENLNKGRSYVPKLPEMRKYKLEMESVKLSEEMLGKYDAVIIATDHTNYDYKWIVKHAKLVVDTRNSTKDIHSEKNQKSIITLFPCGRGIG